MVRKFLGAFFLLSVLAVTACGDSSSDASDDECTVDPLAPGCQVEEPDVPAME